jgi:hypothetical protein
MSTQVDRIKARMYIGAWWTLAAVSIPAAIAAVLLAWFGLLYVVAH